MQHSRLVSRGSAFSCKSTSTITIDITLVTSLSHPTTWSVTLFYLGPVLLFPLAINILPLPSHELQRRLTNMPHTVTEFIYLKLKPTVKPEDPSNLEGKEFLSVLNGTKNQSGYESSAYGRTLEDESVVVWAIGLFPLIYDSSMP